MWKWCGTSQREQALPDKELLWVDVFVARMTGSRKMQISGLLSLKWGFLTRAVHRSHDAASAVIQMVQAID